MQDDSLFTVRTPFAQFLILTLFRFPDRRILLSFTEAGASVSGTPRGLADLIKSP